jgi:ubiquitin-protein ligase
VTMVYHPHINNDGRIAIDILGSNWSPELDLSRSILVLISDSHKPLTGVVVVLLSVRSLLSQFDLDLPLVPDIAHVSAVYERKLFLMSE